MDCITTGSTTGPSLKERILPVKVVVALFSGGFALASWSFETADTGGTLHLPVTEKAAKMAQPLPGGMAIAASGPQESAPLSLRNAIKGDDPVKSAPLVLAWLRAATVEDFRQLAATPEDVPTPYFAGFDKEFRSAYFSAVAKRWLELDPEGALAAMQRVDAALDEKKRQSGFLVAIARLQPELALEKLPLNERYLTQHTRVALETLGSRDRNSARRFAEQLTDKALRAEVEKVIAKGIAQSDPLAAVDIALSTKDENLYWEALQAAERIGSGMVRQVLQAGGDRIGLYAISSEFVIKHPDLVGEIPEIMGAKASGYLSEEAAAAADQLSVEERERLLAGYDSLPGGVRDSVVAAVACSWARTEPQKAAEWALAHSKVDDGANAANTAAQNVFLRWINNDPDTALAWWRALPASELRDALGTNASTYMAENGQLDSALEMFRPLAKPGSSSRPTQRVSISGTMTITYGGGSLEEGATAHLAQLLGKDDPAAAGKWFANLPTGVASDSAAREVVNAWYNRDPEAVARWVETVPQGEARDQAARAFIQQAAQVSPAGAAEWVETVADQELRQQAALWVLAQWRNEDPSRARQWIANLRGVDPEWQATILRRWK